MNNSITQFKFFLIIFSLYCSFLCSGALLAYKIIDIKGIMLSAGSITMCINYLLCNIATEVYGYECAKKLIWAGVLSEIIFAITCYFLNSLPSPVFWTSKNAYDIVCHNIIKTAFSFSVANFFGIFLNAYSQSKSKILMKGKYYILRYLISMYLGETIYVAIFYIILFGDSLNIFKIFQLMTSSLIAKYLITLILSFPTKRVVISLKTFEKLDTYDNHVDFNPFKVNL